MSKLKFAACEWCFPCWGGGIWLSRWPTRPMNAYPLRDPGVQAYYLEAGEKYHIEFPQIHLYTLGHQGYYRSRLDSLGGRTAWRASVRQ